jgi:hypothetical protein
MVYIIVYVLIGANMIPVGYLKTDEEFGYYYERKSVFNEKSVALNKRNKY